MSVKTKQTEADVAEFIHTFAQTPQRRADAFELLEFMKKVTGEAPKMWGPSIIGFGLYHYKSERSRQEGDWPMTGFSPRKAAISLYVFSGGEAQEALLKDLGKFKMGKGCIYVNKLSDINLDVVEKLMRGTIAFLQNKYPS